MSGKQEFVLWLAVMTAMAGAQSIGFGYGAGEPKLVIVGVIVLALTSLLLIVHYRMGRINE